MRFSLMDILDWLKEDDDASPKKSDKVRARKGRVKVFNTIKDALSQGSYGQIFSTKGADRLYVITKPTWGKKSSLGGKTKVAKGFTPGSSTPSSDFASIKKHAARTLLRHGKGSKSLAKKYGSRTLRKKHGIGGKDGRIDKGKK